MAKLQHQLTKRELREVMTADIDRPTRAKIMSRRGRNTKKWVGLPKPSCKSDFTPLEMVTSSIVHAVGKIAGEHLVKRHREFRISDRAAVLAYMKTRNQAS